MKNMLVAGVAVVAVVLIGAYYLGYLDDYIPSGLNIPGLTSNIIVPDGSTRFDDNQLYLSLVAFTGKSLDRETIYGYISTLDLKMWGVNGYSQDSLATYYQTAWAADGYSPDTDILINGAIALYYNTATDGRGALIKSGPAIELVYGKQCVWIIGEGNPVNWASFVTYIST